MAARHLNLRRHLRRVFLACLATYNEARITSFSNSCAAIYEAIGRNYGNRPNYRRLVARATQSDYVADFELTATRVLPPDELAFFTLVFVQGRAEVDEAMEKSWPKKRY